MSDHVPTVVIEPARPDQMAAVFRLLFYHLPEDDRERRVANALEMLRRKELDPAGALVAHSDGKLRGVLFCQPVAGASGLVWPPQTCPDADSAVQDQLIARACEQLALRGSKLVQSLLTGEESALGVSLERNGFRHITQLWYMRHDFEFAPRLFQAPDALSCVSYASCDADIFRQTLLRTYESTLDCPEVNGVRTIEEVIAGHQSQGRHDPENWWLVLHDGKPVGVLLVSEMQDSSSWDLLYLGIVSEARGRGYGKELTRKALWEARAAGAPQLTLSVDFRNKPALHLYQGVGFEPYDRREVFLKIL
jgi:mycothiol synthase